MQEAKTNSYKEHLQYNEKELSLKKIVFEPRQFFDPCQNFMNPRHQRQNSNTFYFFYPHQSFLDPRHTHASFLTRTKNLWIHATHTTHAKI